MKTTFLFLDAVLAILIWSGILLFETLTTLFLVCAAAILSVLIGRKII